MRSRVTLLYAYIQSEFVSDQWGHPLLAIRLIAGLRTLCNLPSFQTSQ